MVFASTFLFKIKPSDTKKKLEQEDKEEKEQAAKLGVPRNSIRAPNEPDSPLLELDENMP